MACNTNHLGDGESDFRLELTWLRDRTEPYDLGEQEFHLAFRTDRFDELLERTQGRNAVPYDRSIDVQISRLRTRLRDNGREPQLIKTVRGDGYVLATDVRPQFVRPALPVDAPIMPGK